MITNGVDIVSISRVEAASKRSGDAFWRRVLSEEERAIIPSHETRKIEFLAGRFAAKEAVSKALGTGIVCDLREIGIIHDEAGRPAYSLTGKAAELGGGDRFLLSISHDGGTAGAVCIRECPE